MEPPLARRVPIMELVRYYLRLGLLGFGGPVALVGSAKSLIAAEYFNRFASSRGLDASATSAGTEPDDAIPPRVVSGLAADRIDVAERRPRRPTAADVAGSTVVVTFGCDLGELTAGARRLERWDDLPAVSEDFAKARDAIVARVTALLDSAVPPR